MLSVPARWRDLYFNAFSLLCIAGESFLIWYEFARRDEKSDYLDIIMDIVMNTGPVALAAAIFAFMVLKGRDTMLSTWETFSKKRVERGIEIGEERERERWRKEREAQAKRIAENEEERKAQVKRIADLEKRNAELEGAIAKHG